MRILSALSVISALVIAFTLQAARAADPATPETADGLKKVIEDTIAVVKAGDNDKLAAMVKSMKVPDGEAWLKKTFGDEKAKELLPDYNKFAESFDKDGAKFFQSQVKAGKTFISVAKITSGDDENATGAQKKLLAAMKEKTPLYTVHFAKTEGGTDMSLWSFVYVDGGFRLAGKMRMNP